MNISVTNSTRIAKGSAQYFRNIKSYILDQDNDDPKGKHKNQVL